MLQISEAAAKHLRSILEEKGAGSELGLRVWVEKGGCAGYQYEMKLDESGEGDAVVERDGVRVWVDTQSLVFLEGALLDYSDDLTGTGFRIVNPRAARSCGCGTSFEPAVEQPTGSPAG